jgi:hypothetical protein
MKGAKALLDYQTGELGVYQQPYGHSYFMLTGGGGRAALQSGMFTVEKPETPYVVSQEGVGKYVLPSGVGLSRLGAEAYGGVVRPLDERTLAPNEAISRYAGTTGRYNLANLVQQIPAGKAEVPGAKIPWSVEAGMPALSYMDERGIIPGSAIALPASDRLVGSKMVASVPTYVAAGVGVLPTPFVSTTGTPLEQNIAGLRQTLEKRPLDVYLSGGLIGEYFFGEKSPKVVQGFVGSVVDFATGVATLGQWQPAKERMQQTDDGLVAFRAEKAKLESDLSIPASYEKDLSSYEKQKAAYDVKLGEYTQKASQYERSPTKSESEYASLMSEYSTLKKMGASLESTSKSLDVQAKEITGKTQAYESFMKGGVEKGYLVYSGGGLVENPSLTYDYGEYSKAGMSLGTKFREMTGGYTPEQLEMYGRQLEQKQGIQYIPEKIVFGTGAVVATHPEKIATAYGGGAALVIGGGAISGGLQTIGAGTGTAAAAARAALTGGKYVLPVVFTGAMGYSVTEGLTATPERTTINIGKMLPEAAGAAVGGGSAYMLAGRNLPIGFQTTEIKKGVFEGEQPKIIPKLQEIQKSGVLEYGQPERAYIFNLQSGELVKTVTGTEGSVSSFAAIPELPYGGRYGVYHTHVAEPTVFSVAKTEAKALAVGDVSIKGAVMNIADYLTHRAEYKAGGGLPSAQDIVAARGVTAEYKSRYGYESGVVEQGVISPEGINIYGLGRKVRPIEEIYPSTEAMQRAFINYRGIPEESLYTEYGSGRRVPKKESITYVFTEELPQGVKTVEQIRKTPLGDIGFVPKQYEVAPSEFSMKTGTEVMDIGYVLTGRKAGALPSGVVEGLKPPAPLTRGIQLEYMEPGLPGVQGMLTGAPKATRPMTPAEAAFGLKLSIEPIATAIPKGLETRFGGGTGISGRTLEQIVNPEIAPIVQRTTYGTSIESAITQRAAAARTAPVVQAAEAQRIVPSATTRTFEKPVSIGTKQFEETLFGITESEKRAPASVIPSPVTRRIPKGMQIDLLSEALGKRKTTVISRSTEPFRVATESEIRAQIASTRRPAKEFLIREEIAPRQRPATEAEIMQMIKPTQRPVVVAEPRGQVKTEVRVPVQYQKQQVSQQLVQPQIQITIPSQRRVSAPSRVTGVQQIPTQAAAKQQQTPYVPMVLQTAAPTQLQTPAPSSYQKQTPYVPPVYSTVPSIPTPGVPTTPQKTPPTYVPPVFPGVPTYIPPTTRPPTKPPAEPPTAPGIGGFFWPAGTPGSTPGRRPRRAAFMETFMMGLDVGFGMGGRRPRAKSFTTPKKYKTKAPAAKKKGGKK